MLNDKLRILITRLLQELHEEHDFSVLYYCCFVLDSKFDNILNLAKEQMPDLESFIIDMQNRKKGEFNIIDAIDCCDHLIEMLDLEDALKLNIEKGNIFQGAKDKLNEASACFRKDDYTGTINNSNTCLELLLKEKFDIPTTIKNINTAKIIELAIKYDIGPTKFFEQGKKYVTEFDNKIKHMGYKPSKLDAIHAIKSMEELSDKLEKYPITLKEDLINKIYSGV